MTTIEEKINKTPDRPAAVPTARQADVSTPRDLLEKNLKWSQIIYEQNRRIGRILLWSAVARWLIVLLLAAPLVVGAVVIYRNWQTYRCLWRGQTCPAASPTGWDQLIKLLPLDATQREQLKAISK